jgi:hypothetical protein
MSATDVTNRPPGAIITLLVTFNETVSMGSARVEPDQDGFTLVVDGKKPRHFDTAAGAVQVLRRISR